MRAILIFPFFFLLSVVGCTTIEVAREITKASTTVILDITKKEAEDKKTDTIYESDVILKKEKEKIVVERKNQKMLAKKQKKITSINFLGKNVDQLKNTLGKPNLIRDDGNTRIIRYDTNSCRIYLFFSLKINNPLVEYYEARNTSGKLLEKKENIQKCYKEINKNT